MIIQSKALNKEMSLSVYVPKGFANTVLPVLYFLHGRTGSDEILSYFHLDMLIEEMLEKGEISPFIIVCPSIDNSLGVNSSGETKEIPAKFGKINNGRYEDYFLNEVIPYIDANYLTIQDKSGRWIGGMSAGGFAALHFALRNPTLFSKVGGHMPAIEAELDEEDISYFGSRDVWEKYNPILLAQRNALSSDLEVYLDAGDNDEGRFYNGCKQLEKILEEKGMTVQNHVFAGHHNEKYIASNMRKYFLFYAGR